jgi:branched-chain amino acid aminotransferase
MILRAFVDGFEVPASSAQLPVTDRGLMYGHGAFEVLRAELGVALFASRHLARLQRSLEAIGFAAQADSVVAAAKEDLDAAVRAWGREGAYVRLVVTAGSGDMGLSADIRRPTRIVVMKPLPPRPGSPLRVVSLPHETFAAPGCLREHKVLPWLSQCLALAEARRKGADDGLLVAEGRWATEGVSSNLFVYDDGVLRTPPLGGILPGITRGLVLESASELGWGVREEPIDVADLGRSLVFLTSSIRGLARIGVLDGELLTPADESAWARLSEALNRRIARELPAIDA